MCSSDLFFETPVMYQEELENGTSAQYRMYSIDIFGRRSEYSDTIDIKVEKVTPPESPSTTSLVLSGEDEPDISDDVLGKAIKKSISENRGKKGIVIPIFNESPDTVRFTLYRAEAKGVGAYSKPVALANFRFDNPKKDEERKETPITDGEEGKEEPVTEEEERKEELCRSEERRVGKECRSRWSPYH